MTAACSPRPRWSPESLEAPPGCLCAPSRGTSLQGAARAWSMPCWIFPRYRKAHTWRRPSDLAIASQCTGFRSAARTAVPTPPGGARSSKRTFRPAGHTSRARPATSLWAHNDCMQPLGPPEGVLTDGVISLRVPSVEDVDAFVRYAAGHDGLGEARLPLPYAGASRERCLWMVADWLAGWTGEGSYKGPALLLTTAQRPAPRAGRHGRVRLQGAGTIELALSAAPSWPGQGLATRAVLLAVGWLTRERGTDVVELRAGRDSPACQRIAVKSGLFPGRDRQQRRRGDRHGSRRPALHHRSYAANVSPTANS